MNDITRESFQNCDTGDWVTAVFVFEDSSICTSLLKWAAKHIENLRLVAQGGLKALLAYTFNNAFVTVLIIVAIVVMEKWTHVLIS